jgi:hypothetical protein
VQLLYFPLRNTRLKQLLGEGLAGVGLTAAAVAAAAKAVDPQPLLL